MIIRPNGRESGSPPALFRRSEGSPNAESCVGDPEPFSARYGPLPVQANRVPKRDASRFGALKKLLSPQRRCASGEGTEEVRGYESARFLNIPANSRTRHSTGSSQKVSLPNE